MLLRVTSHIQQQKKEIWTDGQVFESGFEAAGTRSLAGFKGREALRQLSWSCSKFQSFRDSTERETDFVGEASEDSLTPERFASTVPAPIELLLSSHLAA